MGTMSGIYRRLLVRIERNPIRRDAGSRHCPDLGEGLGGHQQPRVGAIMNPTRVGVVGGGLAGIAAALTLADAGCRRHACRAAPRLGGLTSSIERDGLSFDNGQHVFLGCCSAYQGSSSDSVRKDRSICNLVSTYRCCPPMEFAVRSRARDFPPRCIWFRH